MEDMMLTPAIRAAVSIASLAATVALGACAGAPALATRDGATATPESPLTIRFENQAETYVDVYFVDELREWWLGRVAPGALSALRIPTAALLETSGYVRLAALAGVPRSGQAARDPHAALTIAQPASSLLGQRWTFQKTDLASPEIFGQRAHAR
jgi:hypothetical protein